MRAGDGVFVPSGEYNSRSSCLKTVWTPFVGEVLSLSPESGNEHDRFAVSGGVGAKLIVVCSAIDPPNTYRRAAAARLPRGYGVRSNIAQQGSAKNNGAWLQFE